MEEFVVGLGNDSEELTPIDIAMDVTCLSYEEIKSCCYVINIPEPEIPEV